MNQGTTSSVITVHAELSATPPPSLAKPMCHQLPAEVRSLILESLDPDERLGVRLVNRASRTSYDSCPGGSGALDAVDAASISNIGTFHRKRVVSCACAPRGPTLREQQWLVSQLKFAIAETQRAVCSWPAAGALQALRRTIQWY